VPPCAGLAPWPGAFDAGDCGLAVWTGALTCPGGVPACGRGAVPLRPRELSGSAGVLTARAGVVALWPGALSRFPCSPVLPGELLFPCDAFVFFAAFAVVEVGVGAHGPIVSP